MKGEFWPYLYTEGSTYVGRPPGILHEVKLSIKMIISGCNSAKKLIFGKKKLQP